jgi:hypothetical protein
MHLHPLRNRTEKLAKGLVLYLFLKDIQINYIISDSVRICICYLDVYWLISDALFVKCSSGYVIKSTIHCNNERYIWNYLQTMSSNVFWRIEFAWIFWIMWFFSAKIQILKSCICYLDVYWLISKISAYEQEYEVCWRVSEANE